MSMGSAEGNLAIWDLELDGSEWLLFFFFMGELRNQMAFD